VDRKCAALERVQVVRTVIAHQLVSDLIAHEARSVEGARAHGDAGRR
jgi:hypothetical protein